MAVDEAVSIAVREGRARPTVRAYTWQPAAVSLGYGQRLSDEINVYRCREYGIDVVRRQTGGRVVLHASELTYSVIAPESHPSIGETAYETYRRISEVLQAALEEAGIPAELAASPTVTPEGPGGACFTYAARFELVVDGRKIVGSAQRRARGVVLQHGSILLGPGHMRLPMLLPKRRAADRQNLMDHLAQNTISVTELLGQEIPYQGLVTLLRKHFARILNVSFHDEGLNGQEKAESIRLEREKYGSEAWTGRTHGEQNRTEQL